MSGETHPKSKRERETRDKEPVADGRASKKGNVQKLSFFRYYFDRRRRTKTEKREQNDRE
jgi:hypothetical protein